MQTANRYIYVTDDGHRYSIYIDWNNKGGKINIEGVELYDKKGAYKGYWHRGEMPAQVVKQFTDTIRRWEWQVSKYGEYKR